MELAHFAYITLLHGWSPETLPRNLKYLYIAYTRYWVLPARTLAHVSQYAAWGPNKRVTSFEKLPGTLEELYVIETFSLGFGTIILTELPQTLRICVLRERFREVHLDFAALPKSTENIILSSLLTKKNVVRVVGESKSDLRVNAIEHRAFMDNMLSYSSYKRKLDEFV